MIYVYCNYTTAHALEFCPLQVFVYAYLCFLLVMLRHYIELMLFSLIFFEFDNFVIFSFRNVENKNSQIVKEYFLICSMIIIQPIKIIHLVKKLNFFLNYIYQ